MLNIKFISLDELLEKRINKQELKIVEVLPEDSYKEGHIPGALNSPLDNLADFADQNFKKSDQIVVYCANYHCPASTQAAELLLKKGYKKILDFKGGKKLWQESGLDLERSS